MKTQEEGKIVIHFILKSEIVQQGETNKEMVQYFIDNLDDEAVSNDLPLITLFIRRIFQMKQKENKSIQKSTPNKGKITQCDFNGNDLSGIISYTMNFLNI